MAPRPLILNFVLFQLGWLACVYGAANHMPWLGLLVTVPVVAWHLYQAFAWRQELKLLILLPLLGILLDQLLLSLHLLSFPASAWPAQWLPPWMWCLWVLFTTTLNVSLRWLKSHYWLSVILGALGSVLAYQAGEKLGAIHLDQDWSLIGIAINWSLAMPAAVYLARRYDGFHDKEMARAA